MLGIHIRSKTYQELRKTLKYAKNIGCSYVQLFNENITDYDNIKELLKKNNLKLVIHSSYIINIASPFNIHAWRTKYLLLEVENSIKNGAEGLIIHLGKGMGQPLNVAYENMYKTLLLICKLINKRKFFIYLENTAGQGTELCDRLDELSIFFSKIKANPKMKNIKLCLDTCHLFAAGYDLRTKKTVDEFIFKLNKSIGIDRVGLLHINDSLNDIGTHKDRHANIGEGFIGLKGLRYFYQYFSKKNIPAILETPVGDYKKEIEILNKKAN
jgi:deoxyribonuclease-4